MAVRTTQRLEHAVDEAGCAPARRAGASELDGFGDGRIGRHGTQLEELVSAEPQHIQDVGIDPRERASGEAAEDMIETTAQAKRAIDELLREGAFASVEPRRRVLQRTVGELTGTHGTQRLERNAPCVCRARHAPGSAQASMPPAGDDGTATSRRGMRPARKARRPACTARRIAAAIRTGSPASASAVFIRMPSTPCSIVRQASEAV